MWMYYFSIIEIHLVLLFLFIYSYFSLFTSFYNVGAHDKIAVNAEY